MTSAVQGESPCALCGSRECVVLAERCRSGEQLRTVVCTACGLGRRDPMPAAEELSAYYHSGYRIEVGKGKRPSKARVWRGAALAASRARDLLPRIPAASATIDVGCGAGDLVYMLKRSGHQARGFDPDSHYIEWSRSVLGTAVERNGVETVSVELGSLDMVTMFHVLEHMRDPAAVLATCSGWLKPGGLFVIEVPNLLSTVQAPGHQFIKPHVHYFTVDTLGAFASRAQLRLESGGEVDRGENVRCYFRKDAATTAVPVDTGSAHRVLRTITGHRFPAHYGTAHPYRRMWFRLSRTVQERLRSLGKSDVGILEEHASRLPALK